MELAIRNDDLSYSIALRRGTEFNRRYFEESVVEETFSPAVFAVSGGEGMFWL